jgi:hypothetical protein
MRKLLFSLAICLVTILNSFQPILADSVPPEKIRQTGIKTTTEVITIGHDEEIYYDLNLTGDQEAKVKLEILDPIYTDPERVPIGNIITTPIDKNLFWIDGFLSFYLTNGWYSPYEDKDRKIYAKDILCVV